MITEHYINDRLPVTAMHTSEAKETIAPKLAPIQTPVIVLAAKNCHLFVDNALKTTVTANVPRVNWRIVFRPYLSAAFPKTTLPA